MLKHIIFFTISFVLGLFERELIEFLKKNKRNTKVKPLSKQNFKRAMRDLEIK